jgi:valyl-tRNA synthetase
MRKRKVKEVISKYSILIGGNLTDLEREIRKATEELNIETEQEIELEVIHMVKTIESYCEKLLELVQKGEVLTQTKVITNEEPPSEQEVESDNNSTVFSIVDVYLADEYSPDENTSKHMLELIGKLEGFCNPQEISQWKAEDVLKLKMKLINLKEKIVNLLFYINKV